MGKQQSTKPYLSKSSLCYLSLQWETHYLPKFYSEQIRKPFNFTLPSHSPPKYIYATTSTIAFQYRHRISLRPTPPPATAHNSYHRRPPRQPWSVWGIPPWRITSFLKSVQPDFCQPPSTTTVDHKKLGVEYLVWDLGLLDLVKTRLKLNLVWFWLKGWTLE